MSARMNDWCEEKHILPEWQSGFRKKRGCLDNIFVLNTVIQLHVRRVGGKMYALFIDFKTAFDSVNHEMLWKKLLNLGISTKMVKIIEKIYHKATLKVKTKQGLTDSININKGVLQGETLSPLLFALFISDLETFLKSKGIRGVSVNHLTEILILGYADDLVILSDSYIGMKKILVNLKEYCLANSLIVNIKKTKIILFQKGGHGHKKKYSPLLYGSQTVEFVKEYTYLGVTFAQNALFEKAAKEMTSKAKLAAASVSSLIHKENINTWEVIEKLYSSLVSSTVLYAAPVYAIRYLHCIEQVRNLFIKRLLNIPQNTPDYCIRLETGASHVGVKILKQIINYVIKILELPNDRYPKICFLKQKNINLKDSKLIKYHWCLIIKSTFFEPIGEVATWENLSANLLKAKKQLLCEKYHNYVQKQDKERKNTSSSLIIYPTLTLQNGTQTYLKTGLSLNTIKIIAQIRMLNKYNTKITIESVVYKVNNISNCPFCNVFNDLYHALFVCPIFETKRNEVCKMLNLENNILSISPAFEKFSFKKIKALANYISEIVKNMM